MIEFDKERHVYTLAATREVLPGVTSILNELEDFRFVKPEVLERARQLGQAVHLACEFLDAGTLDWGSVHELVRPYVAGYEKFLAREKPTILWNEKIVHHTLYRYCGKPDAGVILNGERGILDRKTCRAIDLGLVGPQTAAYRAAANSELASAGKLEQERYRKRWALQLLDDGDYRLKECTDTADEAVFFSCLNIKRWREKHGFTR